VTGGDRNGNLPRSSQSTQGRRGISHRATEGTEWECSDGKRMKTAAKQFVKDAFGASGVNGEHFRACFAPVLEKRQ
jgi:hypothetical protein